MRNWCFAGMVASGLLLLGATPARADAIPAPAGVLPSSQASPGGGGLDPAGRAIPAELLGGGLTPDGGTAAAATPRESALFDGGVPLLGGLGGLLPANKVPRRLPAAGDDTPIGMPPGGTAVDPATADQPIGERRTFSDGGRPVAGEDQDFP